MKVFMSVAAACLMSLSVGAIAAEQLHEIRWQDLRAQGQIKNGAVIPDPAGGAEACLMVENREDAPVTLPLLTIDAPGIVLPLYALKGRIRCEDVTGTAYMEMWSHFPDGGRFFTRTLANDGPMQALRGTSGWRDLALPFSAEGTANRPSRLVLNVVFPGKGRVWLGPLVLLQYRGGEDTLAVSGAWWTDRQGGLVGGIGGSVLGVLGAVIGTLCASGRLRSLVIRAMVTLTVIGAVVLVFGLFALVSGQPYGVYYPLLLAGGLDAVIFGALIPVARRRYTECELRRIGAADIR